jgi:hypothetical protein
MIYELIIPMALRLCSFADRLLAGASAVHQRRPAAIQPKHVKAPGAWYESASNGGSGFGQAGHLWSGWAQASDGKKRQTTHIVRCETEILCLKSN